MDDDYILLLYGAIAVFLITVVIYIIEASSG